MNVITLHSRKCVVKPVVLNDTALISSNLVTYSSEPFFVLPHSFRFRVLSFVSFIFSLFLYYLLYLLFSSVLTAENIKYLI